MAQTKTPTETGSRTLTSIARDESDQRDIRPKITLITKTNLQFQAKAYQAAANSTARLIW